MENQEIKIGFGENGENDYESEIIIRDSFKKGFRTLTVEENGKTYYQQTRHIVCMHKGTETFLDKFLQRFNSTYEESEDLKQLDNVGYVGKTNEDVTRKVAETLLKIANDADSQVQQLENTNRFPCLVVAFDIIGTDGKPVVEAIHNTIEVELAEDRVNAGDYFFVLRELAEAVDRMASKGIATHLFYQRPVPAPQEKPCTPNRKGLVRDFEFRLYHSQIQESPQDSHIAPSNEPSR